MTINFIITDDSTGNGHERPNCNRDLKDLGRTAAIIQWLTFVHINFKCSSLQRLFLKLFALTNNLMIPEYRY